MQLVLSAASTKHWFSRHLNKVWGAFAGFKWDLRHTYKTDCTLLSLQQDQYNKNVCINLPLLPPSPEASLYSGMQPDIQVTAQLH